MFKSEAKQENKLLSLGSGKSIKLEIKLKRIQNDKVLFILDY